MSSSNNIQLEEGVFLINAHGSSVKRGDVAFLVGGINLELARADVTGKQNVVVVLDGDAVPDSGTIFGRQSGIIRNAFDSITPSPGDTIWLNDSANSGDTLTNVLPTTFPALRIGVALSSTDLLVDIRGPQDNDVLMLATPGGASYKQMFGVKDVNIYNAGFSQLKINSVLSTDLRLGAESTGSDKSRILINLTDTIVNDDQEDVNFSVNTISTVGILNIKSALNNVTLGTGTNLAQAGTLIGNASTMTSTAVNGVVLGPLNSNSGSLSTIGGAFITHGSAAVLSASWGGVITNNGAGCVAMGINLEVPTGLSGVTIFGTGNSASDRLLAIASNETYFGNLSTLPSIVLSGGAIGVPALVGIGDRPVNIGPGTQQLGVKGDTFMDGELTVKGISLSDGSYAQSLHTHHGARTILVNTMANFPAAVAGVRTLVANTAYIINADISTSDRFALPDNSNTNIRSEEFNTYSLTYTGSDTFFSGDAVGLFQTFDIALLNTGSGTLFDITGGIPGLAQVGVFNSRTAGWASLGTLTTARPFLEESAFIDSGGMTWVNPLDFRVVECLTLNTSGSGIPLFTIEGKLPTTGKISDTTYNGLSGEAFLNIRPDIGDFSAIRIIDNSIKGSGEAYFTGTVGAFTAVADVGFASETITSVADSSGVARFNFSGGPPTVFVNQEVTISGYVTNTDYNVTGIITATDGTGFFEISSIAFGSDESGGAFVSDTVEITDATHGRSEGEGLCLKETINYDGGATIYNVLTNTFQVNRAFVITEAGTWDTGSITVTEPRVFGIANTSEDPTEMVNSFDIAAMTAEDITTTTTINTQFVFEDLDLDNKAVALPAMELWRLIDINTGEMEYFGLEPFHGQLTATISGISSGAPREYHFRSMTTDTLGVDDVAGPVQAMTIRTDTTACPIVGDINVVKGQTVRIQASNNDGDQDLDLRFLTVIIAKSA